jgi:hypothetical protein
MPIKPENYALVKFFHVISFQVGIDYRRPAHTVAGSMPEPIPRKTRIQPGRRNSLVQVLDLQAMTYRAAELISNDIQDAGGKEQRAKLGQALSQVVKSWETLEDRKRILRGKPLPGSKRPAVDQPKRSKATPYGSPSE